MLTVSFAGTGAAAGADYEAVHHHGDEHRPGPGMCRALAATIYAATASFA